MKPVDQSDERRDDQPLRQLLGELTAKLRLAREGKLHEKIATSPSDPLAQDFVAAINGVLDVLVRARAAATAAAAETESLDESLIELEERLAAEAEIHQKTTRELERQRSVLHHVVDSLPYCMFWRDRDGTYLGANQNKLRALGLSSVEELVGKTAYETGVTREEADYYRQVDRLVMDSGEPIFNLEETQKRPDGTHTLLVSKVPLRDESGAIIGILGMYVDVTERRHLDLAPAAALSEAAPPG